MITDLPSRMPSETAVDPVTWRLIVLRGEVRDDDGTRVGFVEVETLQPPEWIAEERAEIGALVHFSLDLMEMGLSDELAATVMAIKPCPPVQSGTGRVVLTTVSSPSNSVIELSVRGADGRNETICPTTRHQFYDGIVGPQTRRALLDVRTVTSGATIRPTSQALPARGASVVPAPSSFVSSPSGLPPVPPFQLPVPPLLQPQPGPFKPPAAPSLTPPSCRSGLGCDVTNQPWFLLHLLRWRPAWPGGSAEFSPDHDRHVVIESPFVPSLPQEIVSLFVGWILIHAH